MFWYALTASAAFVPFVVAAPEYGRTCRNLPGDRNWPSVQDWDALNSTVGGRLIRGVPLAESCYGVNAANSTACAKLKDDWSLVDPL